MEQGEGGRETHCPAPGRWRDMVFAWWFTHTPVAAQWAWAPCKPQGSTNSVPRVVSLVSWSRRDGTLASQHKYVTWLPGLFQNWKFSWRFFPPPLMTPDIEGTASHRSWKTAKNVFMKQPHVYISFNKKSSFVQPSLKTTSDTYLKALPGWVSFPIAAADVPDITMADRRRLES